MNSGTYISVELSKAQEAYDRAEVLGLLPSQNTNENKDNLERSNTKLLKTPKNKTKPSFKIHEEKSDSSIIQEQMLLD